MTRKLKAGNDDTIWLMLSEKSLGSHTVCKISNHKCINRKENTQKKKGVGGGGNKRNRFRCSAVYTYYIFVFL